MLMTYDYCMNQISQDEIFEGLLGYGLFSDKLPPFLTSENYYKYVKTHPFSDNKYHSQFVYFNNYRNINIPRVLGIPTPFAYANLCKSISDNWNNLQTYFSSKTNGQSYKLSRIHLRKLTGEKKLFKMNYDNWKIDGFPEPNLIIDKKFIVKADISNCFPSMYSHSLCWALVGKATEKANNPKDKWWNLIDKYTQAVKDKETHGFLIGPHASNLLSEIILTDIDSNLYPKWKFIRNIDDYTCYVKSQEEAENFILDLVTELKKYDLLLNTKKTKIISLPQSFDDDWIRELNESNYLLNSNFSYIDYNNVRNYLDSVISLYKKYNNASIISYAFKVLSGQQNNRKKYHKSFSKNAIEYLKQAAIHYTLLFPYLISFFEETIMLPFNMSGTEIKNCANLFYDKGIETRNYEMVSYSILFSIKNRSVIDNFNLSKILSSEDCILLILSYLYVSQNGMTSDVTELMTYAKTLASNDEDMNRNWIFVYEILSESELKDPWKIIKKQKVTFIDSTKLSY